MSSRLFFSPHLPLLAFGSPPQYITRMETTEKSYGWMGVDMPRDIALRLAVLQRAIDPEDLYTEKAGYGLEKNPHTTLAYGHEEETPETTRQAIADFLAGEGTIGELSHFEQPDYKVLKFSVDSKHMQGLNKRLRERISMPGETFSEYSPHVTVAYLKPDVDPSKYQRLARLLSGRRFPVNKIRWGNPKDEYKTLLLKEVLEKTAQERFTEWALMEVDYGRA